MASSLTDSRADPADQLQVSLSSVAHWVVCPRQWGLSRLADVWLDDTATLEGSRGHERVDLAGHRSTGSIRTYYAVPLWHDTLGLVGKADAVEFDGSVYCPVEYKRGTRHILASKAQLVGQAMCLEYMTNTSVSLGYLYSLKSTRRTRVPVTSELRQLVVEAAAAIRHATSTLTVPPLPADLSRVPCASCSLLPICQPEPRTSQGDNNA